MPQQKHTTSTADANPGCLVLQPQLAASPAATSPRRHLVRTHARRRRCRARMDEVRTLTWRGKDAVPSVPDQKTKTPKCRTKTIIGTLGTASLPGTQTKVRTLSPASLIKTKRKQKTMLAITTDNQMELSFDGAKPCPSHSQRRRRNRPLALIGSILWRPVLHAFADRKLKLAPPHQQPELLASLW